MTKITGAQTPYSITVRKKIGRSGVPESPAQFGVVVIGKTDFGSLSFAPDQEAFGIYQMRMCKEGKVPIRMKFYAPTESEARLANPWRGYFANAVAAWQVLTSEQKQVYNENAKGKNLSGYTLFIKNYLRSS
jgi:hypothetical protein